MATRSTAGRWVTGSRDAGLVEVVWARPVRHERLTAMLDRTERSRLALLRDASDRDHYVATRALLRLVLGERWAIEPAAVAVPAGFHRVGGSDNRRTVRGPAGAAPLHVSLARAGNRVVVAVTGHGPLGVDVQPIDAAGEAGQRCPVTVVRKEAILKATGRTADHNELEVTGPGERPRLVSWPSRPVEMPPVQVMDLDVGRGYAACLALLTSCPATLRLRRGDAWLRGDA